MNQPESSLYPQAQPMTDDEISGFLAQSLIAKLCTYNRDGTIHIAPVWFKYENGEMVLGTQELTQKVKNIKRDDRVSILVDTTEPRLKGVIFYGNAELMTENVIPIRISIFKKYIDPENASEFAENLAKKWKPIIIRIKPKRVISFDYGKGFGISSEPDANSKPI